MEIIARLGLDFLEENEPALKPYEEDIEDEILQDFEFFNFEQFIER